MNRTKSSIIAASVFSLVVGTGAMLQTSLVFAGDTQKSAEKMKQKAFENVPENIERSAPSGEKSLEGGSGPGSRSDQLTEMDEVEGKENPTNSKKLLKEKGIAAESAKGTSSDGKKKDKK